VSWQGSRYSVPWEYAGKQVWVRDPENHVEVRYGAQRIARHMPAPRKHVIVTQTDHHAGIPLATRRPEAKTLVHLRQTAPEVEIRPLAAYESVTAGGAR
jgi:Mu transposase, C-terminal domain